MLPIVHQNINNQQTNCVNARDLHEFLESGKDFSNWIKSRIQQYSFVENKDFIVFAQIGENLQGGRPVKEYHISLDMAKELSMVERNAKGKEAREYFIECERQAKSQSSFLSLPDYTDPEQALLFALEKIQENKRLLAISHEQSKVIETQESTITLLNNDLKEVKPKGAIFDMMCNAKNGFPFRASAQILNNLGASIDGKSLSIVTFPRWLRDNDYLMSETTTKTKNGETVKVQGEKWNMPFQKYSKYFITTPNTYYKKDGEVCVSYSVSLNISGLIYFGRKLGVESDAVTEWLLKNGYIELSDKMILSAI